MRFSQGARSFKNPSLPGDILFHPDPIYIFKSLRNASPDHGIVFKLDGRNVAVGMKDFRKVLNMQKHGEASMCPKLTEKHLDCEGHTRQNVLLAFQLLSRSVANCLIQSNIPVKIIKLFTKNEVPSPTQVHQSDVGCDKDTEGFHEGWTLPQKIICVII